VLAREKTLLKPEKSGSAASDTWREQIVRSVHHNILFYDEHVIGLYH
jgi:hypothetical protein